MKFEDVIAGAPNTVKTQRCLFRKHIEPNLYPAPTANGEFEMVLAWQRSRLSYGTMRNLVSLLDRYWRWKAQYQIDVGQALKFIKSAGRPAVPTPWWDARQMHWSLRHSDGLLHQMMLVTLHTGIRKGELLALTMKDIDLKNKKILIRHSKSGSPRTVPMSKKVAELFSNGYAFKEEGPIFECSDPNKMLSSFQFDHHIHPRIPWHGLRHTFATIMLESGHSLKLVSTCLGHKNTSTTMNIYWHCLNSDLNLGVLDE